MRKIMYVLIGLLVIEIAFSIGFGLIINEEGYSLLEKIVILHSTVFSFIAMGIYNLFAKETFYLDSQYYNFLFSYLFIFVFSLQLLVNTILGITLMESIKSKSLYIYIGILFVFKTLLYLVF